jgi:hypothetical protein
MPLKAGLVRKPRWALLRQSENGFREVRRARAPRESLAFRVQLILKSVVEGLSDQCLGLPNRIGRSGRQPVRQFRGAGFQFCVRNDSIETVHSQRVLGAYRITQHQYFHRPQHAALRGK